MFGVLLRTTMSTTADIQAHAILFGSCSSSAVDCLSTTIEGITRSIYACSMFAPRQGSQRKKI
eukprot:m.293259 g.293259  ORF g.293259 m.293259 type:complete len:63 (-) comp19798_c0_seq1:20-208(-)